MLIKITSKKLKIISTHGGTRTRNLQIRSLTPYPIRLREPFQFFNKLLFIMYEFWP